LADWYSGSELGVFRLSSKSHWDIPVDLGNGVVVHVLASHPTPPVFDGAEDRNGKRNADEIRFWADYIDPARSGWVVDDAGVRGGLRGGERFVVMGDCNADPVKGDSVPGAAQQLTGHGLVNAQLVPSAQRYGNSTTNTADFAQDLRVDYVLPSRAGWVVLDGAVYWPVGTHPQASLVANANASDHRLVWLEVRPAVSLEEAVVGLDAAWNGSAVRLTWHGSTGYRYAVEEAAELAEGNWKPVVGAVVSGSASAGFSVALVPEAGGRWYYRLRVSFSEGG
jgi:3-phytase/alkaline phosphatase D